MKYIKEYKEIDWEDWEEILDDPPFKIGDNIKIIDNLYMWHPTYKMWKIIKRDGEYSVIKDLKFINHQTMIICEGKLINIPYNGWVFKLKGKWPWYKYEDGILEKK